MKKHGFLELSAPFPSPFPSPGLAQKWSLPPLFGPLKVSGMSSLLYCVDIGVSLVF